MPDLRDLRPGDAPAWRELFLDLCRSDGRPTPDEARISRAWTGLAGPATAVRGRVLMDGDRMLGFIAWLVFPARPGPGTDCHLEDFGVIAAERGKGHGTALFDDLLTIARREGHRALLCFPNDTDFAAQTIFARHAAPDRDFRFTIPLHPGHPYA